MVALACVAAAGPAVSQRTDNNATTAAEDAFGKSVGDQSIGIYSAGDVRGFSPADAGNLRIEGLYFDQQANLRDRLTADSTIRVGLSAQSYPFPAPTGIADYSLRRPGKAFLASIGLNYGPWESKGAELDLQVPIIGDTLGVAGGGGFYRGGNPQGTTPKFWTAGIIGRWAPAPGVEILPFWGHMSDHDEETSPIIFSSGPFLPKKFDRNAFLGQPWADYKIQEDNYGVVALAHPAKLDVRLGIFRSVNAIDQSPADILFDTDRTGAVGRRLVVIEKNDRYASTSGELRVAGGFETGPIHHTLIGSVRARAQDRRYGGAAVIDLGPSRSDRPDFRPEPATPQGPKTTDRVRQVTGGLGYQAKWKDVGELSLGLQKTRYTKAITDPDPAIHFPESKASPWLPSATAALYITPKLIAYAGFTRGLEESPVAPTEAVNLNEAPPAIRTEQKDAGIRWSISPRVTAVLGVFDVSKPYFNLDPGLRFRRLGMIRNRGVEFSMAGQVAKGVSLVVGNVMVNSRVSGEEVDRGLIGKKPVASFVRHTIASIDYRLPFYQPLSFDLFFEATSKRVADAANSYYIPARWVASVGGRYRFKLRDNPVLLRWQVQNVTNKFGWNNGSSGFFVPNGSRRYVLSLAADF
jgi:iron complex outermembrane receptor protein